MNESKIINTTYMDFKPLKKVNHLHPKNVQHSQTLNRTTVIDPYHKVQAISHPANNRQSLFQDSEPNSIQESFKVRGYDPNRYQKIRSIPRSDLIDRFSSTTNTPETSHPPIINAQPVEPQSNPSCNNGLQPNQFNQTQESEASTIPNPNHQTVASSLFLDALNKAPLYDSPQTVRKKLKHKKHLFRSHPLATSLTLIVAIFIGGSILFFHNLNQITIDIAASRAGFTPTTTKAMPSGFNLVKVSYSAGIIETSFKSNSDNRSYSIIEKKSNLTNNQLLDNYVLNKAGLNYQTISEPNLTIYTYNNNSIITWVKNGIWYLIKNNNSLSTHQIIDIALSM